MMVITFNGVVIASNISECIDFNLSMMLISIQQKVRQHTTTTKYINQSAGLQMNSSTKSGWFYRILTNQTIQVLAMNSIKVSGF
jgi:hypothetical protein